MRLLFTLFISLLAAVGAAQSGNALGMHLGIPIANEKLAEGRRYKPYQLLLYYDFARLVKGDRHTLSIYLEPQFVWVHFSPKDKKEWELGANLGFEYRLRVAGQTALTAAVGSGPHVITVETSQQVKGFIFSDNFTAGIRQPLGNTGVNLDLRCRFRHISNANLKKPNQGIDNWFLIAGITRVW